MQFSAFLGIILVNIFFFMSQVVSAKDTPLYVFVKEGNIYYVPNVGKRIRLTARNTDSNPILSSDRHVAAFIRTNHRIIPKECASFADSGSKYGNEI